MISLEYKNWSFAYVLEASAVLKIVGPTAHFLLHASILTLQFWKICPMEDILVRLEIDARPVSRRLVSLIFNSFLPVNQPEEVWCERCVTLIQMNRAAARKFYQYAHEHTASTNIGLNLCFPESCCSSPSIARDATDRRSVFVI